MRRCWRRNQQTVGYIAATSRKLDKPLSRHGSIIIGGGQIIADGRGPRVHSNRRTSNVFGHDWAKLVLHGRNES